LRNRYIGIMVEKRGAEPHKYAKEQLSIPRVIEKSAFNFPPSILPTKHWFIYILIPHGLPADIYAHLIAKCIFLNTGYSIIASRICIIVNFNRPAEGETAHQNNMEAQRRNKGEEATRPLSHLLGCESILKAA
jgi:hypothetical protein